MPTTDYRSKRYRLVLDAATARDVETIAAWQGAEPNAQLRALLRLGISVAIERRAALEGRSVEQVWEAMRRSFVITPAHLGLDEVQLPGMPKPIP